MLLSRFACVGISATAASLALLSTFAGERTSSPSGIDAVISELRRFTQSNGTIVDFAGGNGEVELPTPEECRLGKPNAIGWAVPISNSPFFTGDYLYALVQLYGKAPTDAIAAEARHLFGGLRVLQDVCERPGCIARGTGADGKCHYAMSSNDGVVPFLLGLEAYMDSPISTAAEKADCRRRLLAELHALEDNGWRVPGETPEYDSSGFNDKAGPNPWPWARWCQATHLLYAVGLLDRLEGTERRKAKLEEKLADGKTRYETLAGCPGFKPHENWYSSHSVLITRRLSEDKSDSRLADAAAASLARIGATAVDAIGEWRKYRPNLGFSTDWRVQNKVWKPQRNSAESEALGKSGQRKLWHDVSPAIPEEWNHVMAPFSAMWNAALAGDDATRRRVREEMSAALAGVDFRTLHFAGFFFIVNAWSELQ